MKTLTFIILILSVLPGCKDDDPELIFPECVGIETGFNPYSIINPYSGKIWDDDTVIFTQFIFTDYVNYNLILTAERSWNMWIKFTNGTTTKYQSCNCYYSFTERKYYAWTGFDYKGHYSSWDFTFENFECSKLSGLCRVVLSDSLVNISYSYRFEGKR